MIHIAIVEDEAAVQRELSEMIERFSRESGEPCRVTVFSDGDEILDEYTADYDIILLDIQMKRLDGLKTADLIRELDTDVIIVFVTNLMNFAVRGYAVNAMDFLVKPIKYPAFSQLLKKAVAAVEKKKRRYITIPTSKGLLRLDASRITYLESFGHRLTVHTETEEFTISETLKNMEILLKDSDFNRCNNSYLVNLAYVEKVESNLVTICGTELTISRPRKKQFMEALAAYIGGVR